MAQITGGQQSRFDMLGRLHSRPAKRNRCEIHKPLVELVYRCRDIGLPQMRLIRVDASRHRGSIRSSKAEKASGYFRSLWNSASGELPHHFHRLLHPFHGVDGQALDGLLRRIGFRHDGHAEA